MSEIDNSDLIAIGALVVGSLGFFWGVYTHFTNRRVASLLYEVNQLSDYDVPESFVAGLPTSLASIKFQNVGNSQATDVMLDISTLSKIERFEISPEKTPVAVADTSIKLQLDKMNPAQEVRIQLYCAGSAVEDQIRSISLSHSGGVGIDRKTRSLSSIDFSVLGMSLTYDIASKAVRFK